MQVKLSKFMCVLLAFILAPAMAQAAKTTIKMPVKVCFVHLGESFEVEPRLKGIREDDLIWESDEENIVAVRDGKVEGKAVGRATVTASAGKTSGKIGVVVLPETVELEKGETYRLPYGTVERYKTYDKSIATIGSKGKITGKKPGETKIRVSYGSQKLYVKVIVSEDAAMIEQSKAAKLDCADETSQIILVEHKGGSSAKLSVHEKKNGIWRELHSCNAVLGKNGIDKTREGDKKTPTGTYNLMQPFGIKNDPGAKMDYIKVGKYHYWCGTSGSEYYNQLIDMRKINRKYTNSDEYLIDYGRVYNYCMFIDYNAEGEAGKGSCIFLHCTGSKNYTAGCIAVEESVMKKIIKWAEPGVKIVIQ